MRLIKFLDVDADKFLQAAGIPQTEVTIYDALDDLCTGLKGAGLWTKMKAIYPFVGGNATAHKFNLKDPRDLNEAYRLTFNGTITHSTTGVQGAGNAFSYCNTNLPFNPTLSVNNSHLSFYSLTNTDQGAGVRMDIGAFGPSGGSAVLTMRRGDNLMFGNIGGTDIYASNNIGAYYGIITRTSSTSAKLYKNGRVLTTLGATNPDTGPTGNVWILGASFNNSINWPCSIRKCAFASIGEGLSDAESANLYKIVQAFNAKLGRAV